MQGFGRSDWVKNVRGYWGLDKSNLIKDRQVRRTGLVLDQMQGLIQGQRAQGDCQVRAILLQVRHVKDYGFTKTKFAESLEEIISPDVCNSWLSACFSDGG